MPCSSLKLLIIYLAWQLSANGPSKNMPGGGLRANSSTRHTYCPTATLFENTDKNPFMEENLQCTLNKKTFFFPSASFCSSLIFFASHVSIFFSFFQPMETAMNTYEKELKLAQTFIFSKVVKRMKSGKFLGEHWVGFV